VDGKQIFPDAHLPSLKQIAEAVEGLFVIEDVHNFGPDYDPTLRSWYDNFESHWEELRKKNPGKYTEQFRRKWRYYLLMCAGAFRARSIGVCQIVLSPRGVAGGYKSLR
jgi:cyclopropane-fatty-acyl-phospholipid synthase